MSTIKQKKIEEVKNLTEKIKGFQSMILSDFTGLSVEKLRKLRQEFKKSGIYFKVIKKTLFKILIEKQGINTDDKSLSIGKDFKGSVSMAVDYGEGLKAPKILYDFSKNNEALKIISGIINGKIFSSQEIIDLAKLPTKEELIAKLMFVLKFPLNKLAMTLKEVEKRKVVN